MIIFDLSCDNGHKFEGWFRSGDDFDQQLQTRLITCPQCDSHVVKRIPVGARLKVPSDTR